MVSGHLNTAATDGAAVNVKTYEMKSLCGGAGSGAEGGTRREECPSARTAVQALTRTHRSWMGRLTRAGAAVAWQREAQPGNRGN